MNLFHQSDYADKHNGYLLLFQDSFISTTSGYVDIQAQENLSA